jgi:hypothetical protein
VREAPQLGRGRGRGFRHMAHSLSLSVCLSSRLSMSHDDVMGLGLRLCNWCVVMLRHCSPHVSLPLILHLQSINCQVYTCCLWDPSRGVNRQ